MATSLQVTTAALLNTKHNHLYNQADESQRGAGNPRDTLTRKTDGRASKHVYLTPDLEMRRRGVGKKMSCFFCQFYSALFLWHLKLIESAGLIIQVELGKMERWSLL